MRLLVFVVVIVVIVVIVTVVYSFVVEDVIATISVLIIILKNPSLIHCAVPSLNPIIINRFLT